MNSATVLVFERELNRRLPDRTAQDSELETVVTGFSSVRRRKWRNIT